MLITSNYADIINSKIGLSTSFIAKTLLKVYLFQFHDELVVIDDSVGRVRRRPGQVDGGVVKLVEPQIARHGGEVFRRQHVHDVRLGAPDARRTGNLLDDQGGHKDGVVGVRTHEDQLHLIRPNG